MIGAIQQKLLEQRRIAGDRTGAQPGRVRSLGQAVEDHQPRKTGPAQLLRGLERTKRRPVAIDLRIALVRRDDEAMAIRPVEQRTPLVERQHPAGRVGGRTHVDQLRASPLAGAEGIEVQREARGVRLVEKERFGAGQNRRAFIDLVERIRRDDCRRRARRIDHRLPERKQRLASAVHRQHLRARIERHVIAPLEPSGDGVTEGVASRGRRIHRQPVEVCMQRAPDQVRRRVLRLADRQPDRRAGRRQTGQQRAEFLEWVRLKLLQT